MLKFIKFALYGWLLLHSASSTLHGQNVDDNLHNNESKVKEEKLPPDMQQSEAVAMAVTLEKANDPEKLKENDQLKLIPMPLLVDEQEAVIKNVEETKLEIAPLNVEDNKNISKEVAAEVTEIPLHTAEKEDTPPSPLDESSSLTTSLNRTGRQLFYSPNFFYIQNIGAEGSKCITSRGLLGICMAFDKCRYQQQRNKRQLALYSLTQLPYFTPYVPRQDEVCSFYDQYSRTSPGVCCTGINNIIPIQPGVQPIQPEQPEEQQPPMEYDENGEMTPVEDIIPAKEIETTEEDSEVLEAPDNFHSLQPEPPKYDNNELQDGNHIGYDPVDENLKQAQLFNNYMQYPWPPQFLGFSGVQQWPPPLPTHPPSADSWPPPIPTHPPNHHYPTHPPPSQGQFTPPTTATTKRPISAVTTRRPPPSYPGYPNYPTYRPIITSTTTATTKRPFVPTDEGGGVSPAGLPLQCGTKNVGSPDQERIVGGTNASPHEFPWIAVLFKSGKQFCGGSLITNSHILTAAHCVARMTSWDVAALTIHLGDYNIRTDFEVQHVARRVKRLVRHKGFDFSILHNDVAVLTLSEPVKFSQEIQPICLPTSATQQTRSYSGHVATVAGWGSLRENGPQPSILQKVQIPIWTNSECAQKYGRAAPGGIIESMICAGQASKDSCSGDSGGPLIVSEGGRYVQVGIVSWGIGCGKGQYPGVYTRVTSLLPWIYKNIK